MPRPNLAALVSRLGLTAAVVALAGCASMQPQTPEQAVQARAQARWDALIAGDFERAWTYADAATRKQTPQDIYKNRFGSAGAWKEAAVLKATCQPERCIARIRLTTLNMVPTFARSMPTITSSFDEEWLREDGHWHYKGVHRMSVGQIEEIAPAAPAAEQ